MEQGKGEQSKRGDEMDEDVEGIASAKVQQGEAAEAMEIDEIPEIVQVKKVDDAMEIDALEDVGVKENRQKRNMVRVKASSSSLDPLLEEASTILKPGMVTESGLLSDQGAQVIAALLGLS